jgi:hypothetical protein
MFQSRPRYSKKPSKWRVFLWAGRAPCRFHCSNVVPIYFRTHCRGAPEGRRVARGRGRVLLWPGAALAFGSPAAVAARSSRRGAPGAGAQRSGAPESWRPTWGRGRRAARGRARLWPGAALAFGLPAGSTRSTRARGATGPACSSGAGGRCGTGGGARLRLARRQHPQHSRSWAPEGRGAARSRAGRSTAAGGDAGAQLGGH